MPGAGAERVIASGPGSAGSFSVTAESYEAFSYPDPPLAGSAERLRAYIVDLREIVLPEGHPQTDDLRDDIAAAERMLAEVEQEAVAA